MWDYFTITDLGNMSYSQRSTTVGCQSALRSFILLTRVFPSHDSVETTALFLGDGAAVAKGATAIPKLPTKVGEQPGGAGSEGAIFCVTACGIATGFAMAVAAQAIIASEYRILSVLLAA